VVSGANPVPATYCAYADLADAASALNDAKPSTAISYYDGPSNSVKWLLKLYNGNKLGAYFTATQTRVIDGFTSHIVTTYTMLDSGGGSISGTSVAAVLKQAGYTTVLTSPTAPTNTLTLAQINAELGTNFTGNETLTVPQLRTILNNLKSKQYLEASKLTVADGGGIKTYGGKWYANGQQLSYLDIMFAVRVNQLYVVQDSITNYLNQVQKNNAKIKNANDIAAIFAAISPTNADATIRVFGDDAKSTLGAQLLATGIADGLVTVARNSQREADDLLTYLGNKQAVLYKDGVGQICLAMKDGSGNFSHSYFKDISTDTLRQYNVTANYSGLAEIMPSSISKVLIAYGDKVNFSMNTGTLSQTDCSTITTELKSYTSNIDSNNQQLETQLTQYNDKQSETLDNMTNTTKGNTTALGQIGANLGLIA
jgi:hypothetical protein